MLEKDKTSEKNKNKKIKKHKKKILGEKVGEKKT
jgi:hypothetical protein